MVTAVLVTLLVLVHKEMRSNKGPRLGREDGQARFLGVEANVGAGNKPARGELLQCSPTKHHHAERAWT